MKYKSIQEIELTKKKRIKKIIIETNIEGLKSVLEIDKSNEIKLFLEKSENFKKQI